MTFSFCLPPMTVTEPYRVRWQTEPFFKWTTKNPRTTAFFGISENALRSRIRTAVPVRVLVAVIRDFMRLDMSLRTILQINKPAAHEPYILERFHIYSRLESNLQN